VFQVSKGDFLGDKNKAQRVGMPGGLLLPAFGNKNSESEYCKRWYCYPMVSVEAPGFLVLQN
jgi:hypothetical protein